MNGKRLTDVARKRKQYSARTYGKPGFQSNSKSIEADLCNGIATAFTGETGRKIILNDAQWARFEAAGLDMKLFEKGRRLKR